MLIKRRLHVLRGVPLKCKRIIGAAVRYRGGANVGPCARHRTQGLGQREVFRRTHPWRLGLVMILGLFSIGCSGAETDAAFMPCPHRFIRVPEDRHVPASDVNLELLALRLSPGPYVGNAVYERMVRDVKAIRALDTRVESVGYWPRYDGQSLRISFVPGTLERAKWGSYVDWNCINSFIGAKVADRSQDGYLEVQFRRGYKTEVISKIYEQLPGVTHVEPPHILGDGSTIYITRAGPTWSYLFERAGGDCLSGCTEHEFFFFQVAGNGPPKEIGTWKASGEEPPDWVKLYRRQYR
jgi:hypothetical protein